MRGRLYVHPNEDDFRAWLTLSAEGAEQSRAGKDADAAETPVALEYAANDSAVSGERGCSSLSRILSATHRNSGSSRPPLDRMASP